MLPLLLFLAFQAGPAGSDPSATTVWVNPPKPGALPTGVTHQTYFSASMQRDVGYLIYLPPDYAAGNASRYPLI